MSNTRYIFSHTSKYVIFVFCISLDIGICVTFNYHCCLKFLPSRENISRTLQNGVMSLYLIYVPTRSAASTAQRWWSLTEEFIGMQLCSGADGRAIFAQDGISIKRDAATLQCLAGAEALGEVGRCIACTTHTLLVPLCVKGIASHSHWLSHREE